MHYFRKRIGYVIALYAVSTLCQGLIAWLLASDRRSTFAYTSVYAAAFIIMGRFALDLRAVTDYDGKRMMLINILSIMFACIELIIAREELKIIVLQAVLGILSFAGLMFVGRLWKKHYLVAGWTVSVSDHEEGLASNKKYIEVNRNTFMLCGEVDFAKENAGAELLKTIELYNPPYVVASVKNKQLLNLIYSVCDEKGVMVVEHAFKV